MRKRVVIAVFAVALTMAGCAYREVRLPDGDEGFAIECSGTGDSWASCYDVAGELCDSSGYEIINKASDTTEDSASRSMVIKCKD